MITAIHKIVSCEWDGGWFCDKCDSLQHWKEKAYVINNKKYCKKCLTRMQVDVIIEPTKERK